MNLVFWWLVEDSIDTSFTFPKQILQNSWSLVSTKSQKVHIWQL